MNWRLSFPIDLIETHTYVYYALSLHCIFPQTFECLLCARPGEGLGRCTNQTLLALEELPVQRGGQTGEQIICNVLKFKSFF